MCRAMNYSFLPAFCIVSLKGLETLSHQYDVCVFIYSYNAFPETGSRGGLLTIITALKGNLILRSGGHKAMFRVGIPWALLLLFVI